MDISAMGPKELSLKYLKHMYIARSF